MRIPSIARLAAGSLLCLLPALAAAQLHAAGLAARVNGAGISVEKLERSFEEHLRERGIHIAAVRRPERVKALKRETLELLVEQELLWQEASRRGVLADEGEVGQALAALRSRFPSAAAFAARLASEGYTEDGYREHLRRLLSARKLLAQAAASDGAGGAADGTAAQAGAGALMRRLREGARIEILLPL
ncbi:SurA N-terminal domain-containing protein [Caldimonas tepidiphila]|uniref:SurA N-terminal domain-containing protein n=1 Tax=Caldimonas tepidiphila TaxID=2315841 RepID=UPI000E5C4C13|nr:SurA N-terminal domain-containing protein [Caldimonas tepidiphila]